MSRTVFITGASGLLGQAVIARVAKNDRLSPLPLGRTTSDAQWRQVVAASDAGLHLAGVTRPGHPHEFQLGNVGTTQTVVAAVRRLGRPIPILYASSIRALEPTPYGRTKKMAEDLLLNLSRDTGCPITILRLPSFFGVWSKPDYNSAVATFCHDVAGGRNPTVNTPDAPMTLVHLDVVTHAIVEWMEAPDWQGGFLEVMPIHKTTVGQVASIITSFGAGTEPDADEKTGASGCQDHGLVWGLWQTYRSHRNRAGSPSIPAEKDT